MKKYIGVKVILAKEMNRKEYNDYRGWELPENENGEDEGFLVEYLNSPNSNHPLHDGYISWSPKEVFMDAYKEVEYLNEINQDYILQPHQSRVVSEYNELRDKTEKLSAFFSNPLFKGIDPEEAKRLKSQENVMTAYLSILKQRINNFN